MHPPVITVYSRRLIISQLEHRFKRLTMYLESLLTPMTRLGHQKHTIGSGNSYLLPLSDNALYVYNGL